jgi:hypothetical protein
LAELEGRGVPCVCLTAHPFLPLGEAYASSIEYPARLVVFEHPIAGKSESEVREKAEGMVDAVIEAFRRGGTHEGSQAS